MRRNGVDSYAISGAYFKLAISMDTNAVQAIVQKHINAWGAAGHDPMWVVLAAPGDPLNIPGVTFDAGKSAHAGMELPVRAHLIVLNKAMRTESLLTTFLHEYGHALYRVTNAHNFNEVESEAFAIRHSLQALEAEGLTNLAYEEAKAVAEMAAAEPYQSAVARLRDDPLWQTFSPLPRIG